MKNIFLVVFLSLLFLFSQSHAYVLTLKNDFDKKVDGEILTGMKYLYDGKYRNALDSFQKVIDLVPKNPAGYFYYAATLESIMKDHYNYAFQDDFYTNIGKAIDLAEEIIDKEENNAMAHLYLGAAYGYRGIYNAANGSFFQAFIDGSKGYEMLKATIELNPKIYDAYFGIGVYEFYKTYYLKKFLWLKTSGFSKKEAFDKVSLSADKSKYCRQEAEFSLLTLYFSDARYQELVQKAEKMKARFPNKITLYSFLAPSYRSLNKLKESLEHYEMKRKLLKESPYSKPISYVHIDYWETVVKINHGKLSSRKALQVMQNLLKHIRSIETDYRSEKRHLKKFEKKAEESLKEIEEQIKREKNFF